MKRIKKLLLLLAGVALLTAILIVYQWNKPHQSVSGKKGISLHAEALCKAYQEDESAANGRYLDQVLEVSGRVLSVEENQDGGKVVLLACEDELSGVQCTFRENSVSLKPGDRATIKGFCTGYAFTVLLSECMVVSTD